MVVLPTIWSNHRILMGVPVMPETDAVLLQWPTWPHALVVVVRLLLAALAGAALGMNREQHNRAAGLRTHILVAMGAALFVLVARESAMREEAVSRVMQGIVQGIGFLGAGTILKLSKRVEVHGLTTAASIWFTAALGIAAAVAPLWLLVTASLMGWFVLGPLGRIEKLMKNTNDANHTNV
jgi:putative Mg2+ transporter-C (MgtC) family protein